MGTRNLTAVILNGKYVLAQYGELNGFPEGQGAIVLDFCKKYMQTEGGRHTFKQKLARVRFLTDLEVQAIYQQVGSNDGWLNEEQTINLNKLAPYMSSEHGASVLEMIFHAREEEILLRNAIESAAGCSLCEYVYIIDLDRSVFEAYKGFQKLCANENSRFANLPRKKEDDEYQPIQLVGSWNLRSVPPVERLCEAFESQK